MTGFSLREFFSFFSLDIPLAFNLDILPILLVFNVNILKTPRVCIEFHLPCLTLNYDFCSKMKFLLSLNTK